MIASARLMTAVAGTTLAGLALALFPSSASASESRDVTDVWLTSGDVRVASGACRDVPIRLHHNGGHLSRIAANVEVWKGSRYLSESFGYVHDGYGPVNVDYFWCPWEGLGRFRVGPSKVEWSYEIETISWDPYLEMWDTDYDYREGEFRDSSKASFTIKQDSRLSRPKAAKRGKTRTLSTSLKHYNVSASRWRVMKKTPVTLQRRAANGKGSWKSVRTVRTNSSGKATARVKAAKTYQYRFVYRGSGTTWDRTSAVVRR